MLQVGSSVEHHPGSGQGALANAQKWVHSISLVAISSQQGFWMQEL